MNRDTRLKRLKFRSSHRGTREADMMIGGYFDVHGDSWSEAEMDWFEEFLEEQDVDIMAWALGTQDVPERWAGPMIDAFCKLDYITVPK